MIRRKLTRIELQLDDTKELDELFVKASLVNQSFNKSYQQHSSTTIDKQLQTDIDSNSNNNNNIDNPSSSTAHQATTSETTNDIQERIGYNPQPYNPSNRFQLNQSSQQLR